MNVDYINGAFELIGAFVNFLNFRQLQKNREVKGVRWEVVAFFMGWGMWNLFYYPSLGQWASFLGGVLLVTGNAAWVILALRLRCQPVIPHRQGVSS